MTEFHALVRRVIDAGFTPTDISDRLGVSRLAAEHWAAGATSPHPGVEPIFVAKLKELFGLEDAVSPEDSADG